MDTFWRECLWRQFGAAIDMLENAIAACPDALWSEPGTGAFWHLAYHTLFYLDKYLADDPEAYAPPAPYSMELRRLEREGAAPYAKADLLGYLGGCRTRCRTAISTMTQAQAQGPCGLSWLDISRAELMLYNLRHVQHHAAQLNMRLRQAGAEAPDWVLRAGDPLAG